jgi:hypothetical protein
MIVFDLETGPLPWGKLQPLVPSFDEQAAVPDVGPFDPGSVALGNIKDEAKKADKIAKAQANHAELAASVSRRRAAARNKHVAEFVDKAALSARTGMVKAIGYFDDDGGEPMVWFLDNAFRESDDGDERYYQFAQFGAVAYKSEEVLIRSFWEIFTSGPSVHFVGHNIFGFDLPFLVRRSWLLGIDIPKGVRQGRYWSNQFVDTMDVWACGDRSYTKLHDLDVVCGGDGKPDDCTGANFARLLDSGGADREKAFAYLVNDLRMTQRVARTLQLL